MWKLVDDDWIASFRALDSLLRVGLKSTANVIVIQAKFSHHKLADIRIVLEEFSRLRMLSLRWFWDETLEKHSAKLIQLKTHWNSHRVLLCTAFAINNNSISLNITSNRLFLQIHPFCSIAKNGVSNCNINNSNCAWMDSDELHIEGTLRYGGECQLFVVGRGRRL